MAESHEEFINKLATGNWTFGVNNYPEAVKVALGKWGIRYDNVIFSAILTLVCVYCVYVSWHFGWGNLVGIPAGIWMARIGKSGINIFDLAFTVVVGAAASGIASLINLGWNPWLMPMGFVPYMMWGMQKYGTLARIRRIIVRDRSIYDELCRGDNLFLWRVS